MSKFLRDEFLTNLDITEAALIKLNECIQEIAERTNQPLIPKKNDPEAVSKYLLANYTIRFDSKGFRLDSFQEALKHFQDARRVFRFNFSLQSLESTSSNMTKGKSIELRFDANDQNNCILVVQDDDSEWVEGSFSKLKERLNRYKNRNWIMRNRWAVVFVQLLGVIFGFLGSLWIAIKLSPKLAIENALAFTFVIALLVYSNIWTVSFEGILRL